MGPIGSPETSVDNYQYTLCKSQNSKYLIHTEPVTCHNACIWNYRDIVHLWLEMLDFIYRNFLVKNLHSDKARHWVFWSVGSSETAVLMYRTTRCPIERGVNPDDTEVRLSILQRKQQWLHCHRYGHTGTYLHYAITTHNLVSSTHSHRWLRNCFFTSHHRTQCEPLPTSTFLFRTYKEAAGEHQKLS
jgi:hypothetical protein